jgi:hypothetical protein
MARTLRRAVVANGVTYAAGTKETADLAKAVPNAKAWEGDSPAATSAPSGIPPKGGAGSGRDAWAQYAAQHDVQVEEDATRDDIVEALEAAGIPTE